jgi:hypothetical protein
MWKPIHGLWSACKMVGGSALLIAALGLLLVMLFGAPIALLMETRDLLAMDAQAVGVVTRVEIEEGGEATSAARVTYQFTVKGVLVESRRVFPGFAGNYGTYTGGEQLADEFAVGQKCTVFYDSSLPTRCALKFGWFKWSLGFAAAVWGMIGGGYFRTKKPPFAMLAWAVFYFGGGLLFLGPFAIEVREVHWYLLAFIATLISLILYHQVKRNKAIETVELQQPMSDAI